MTDARPAPDIRVGMKFQNNLILAAMEKAGIKTVAELSRTIGVHMAYLGKIINMQETPTMKNGRWRKVALQLADFFHSSPEDLFSTFQQENGLNKNRAHAEMHFSEVQALMLTTEDTDYVLLAEPSTVAEKHELRVALDKAIGLLGGREQHVLRARFGLDESEKTLEQVADELGVTKERVRQIEICALRKLRHPSVGKIIRDAV